MNYKILTFIFISAATHFLILKAYNKQSISISGTQQGSLPAINVRISANKQETKSNPIQKIIAQSKNKQTEHQISLNKKQPDPGIIKNTVAETQIITINTHNTVSSTNINSEPNRSIVSRLLKNNFSRHFYYPKTALRRSWQGKVLLEFVITPQGNIEKFILEKVLAIAYLIMPPLMH